MSLWDEEDRARRGDEETARQELRLQKMTTQELIDKYGEGIIPRKDGQYE